jgi:hypothetical protein
LNKAALNRKTLKIEDLKIKINELQSSLDIINKILEFWQLKTKHLLLETLTKITNEYPIGWHVQKLDEKKNSEGVNIILDSKPIGILEKTETYMSLSKGGRNNWVFTSP